MNTTEVEDVELVFISLRQIPSLIGLEQHTETETLQMGAMVLIEDISTNNATKIFY